MPPLKGVQRAATNIALPAGLKAGQAHLWCCASWPQVTLPGVSDEAPLPLQLPCPTWARLRAPRACR